MLAKALILLILTTFFGCGESSINVNAYKRAYLVVEHTFIADGYRSPGRTTMFFYEGHCLPFPWSINITEQGGLAHDCWQGRALRFKYRCEIAISDSRFIPSNSAFAHELMHCSELDAWHKDAKLWNTVAKANIALYLKGL